jgi:hypothetical protein
MEFMPIINKSKVTEIEPDVNWGLYMWKLPNGRLLQDGNGNYLNIPSWRGDIIKIAAVRNAAKDFGKPEGDIYFKPGVGRATDSERQEQEERMIAGEVLDNDFGAIADALRGARSRGE